MRSVRRRTLVRSRSCRPEGVVSTAWRTDGAARVSAGWAIGAGDADALLLAADRALANAKRAGKDRVLAAA